MKKGEKKKLNEQHIDYDAIVIAGDDDTQWTRIMRNRIKLVDGNPYIYVDY